MTVVKSLKEIVSSCYHLQICMKHSGPMSYVGIPSAISLSYKSHREMTGIYSENGVEYFLRHL